MLQSSLSYAREWSPLTLLDIVPTKMSTNTTSIYVPGPVQSVNAIASKYYVAGGCHPGNHLLHSTSLILLSVGSREHSIDYLMLLDTRNVSFRQFLQAQRRHKGEDG